MIKFWKIKGKKNVDVVLISESSIFKGKIKYEEINHFTKLIENQNTPENLFEIPFSYIKRIENQENKNEIKIYFGKDSEEEIISKNEEIKKEIFDNLKDTIPNLNYSKNAPSIFKYAKPQLFAILFTLGIFLWSLYYAIQIENGVEYVLKGRAGIGAIIYSIGLLGVKKVIFLFSVLIGVAIFSLVRRLKSRSEIEVLNRNK